MTDTNNQSQSKNEHEPKTKLIELEEAIHAKRTSLESESNATGRMVDYIEEQIYPFTFNKSGVKGIEKLCKKFAN